MGKSVEDGLPVGEVDHHQRYGQRSPQGTSATYPGPSFHEPAVVEVSFVVVLDFDADGEGYSRQVDRLIEMMGPMGITIEQIGRLLSSTMLSPSIPPFYASIPQSPANSSPILGRLPWVPMRNVKRRMNYSSRKG